MPEEWWVHLYELLTEAHEWAAAEGDDCADAFEEAAQRALDHWEQETTDRSCVAIVEVQA